ncbi:MAG: hypothetical protein FWG40_07630, partial [Peptococcaceae bacterium]|nr:hypothetical protein [Peptococcaceae bacterium]
VSQIARYEKFVENGMPVVRTTSLGKLKVIDRPGMIKELDAATGPLGMGIRAVDDIAKSAGRTGEGLRPIVQGAEGMEMGMPRGGGIINGRKYSEHALERMAPNTPEVRARLHTRAIDRAEAAGHKPGTKDYSDFINKQIDPRDVPSMVVEDAIKNTLGVPGKYPDTFVHTTPDFEVIVNASGDVITVIPK